MATQFMTDEEREQAEDFIAANIAAGVERSLNPECPVHGHVWAPNGHGRLECSRCLYTPHRPTRED